MTTLFWIHKCKTKKNINICQYIDIKTKNSKLPKFRKFNTKLIVNLNIINQVKSLA